MGARGAQGSEGLKWVVDGPCEAATGKTAARAALAPPPHAPLPTSHHAPLATHYRGLEILLRLNYPGGGDHIASARQFGLRFELPDARDGAPHGSRQYRIRHLGRALVPWVRPLMEPPPSLRGWRTSKVVFLRHHLIVLVN